MAAEPAVKVLGDVVELQRGNTYDSSLLGQTGPVLLGLASIQRNGGFRSDNLKTYGGDSPDKLLLRPGDIYVSLKDVTQSADLLGAVARVPLEVPLGRLTQDTVKLAFKRSDIPKSFVYWLLRTAQYREYCRAHAIGTTNLSLAREDFLAYPLHFPTRGQEFLVRLLESLEQRIELNRRMSETLEAMARALFKSWFVDFDPVRAKAEGRETELPRGISDLFPDNFGDNAVPSAWTIETLLDHADLISGGTPKTEVAEYWDGDIRWASAKDVSQCQGLFLADTERRITTRGLDESSTRMIPRFSTVVVARGATTGRYCVFGRDMAMNQTCYALRSKRGRHFWLNCAFAASIDALVHAAHGSVFDTITTKTFEGATVVCAPSDVIDRFEALLQPMFLRILACTNENRTLAALRDTLLPKLVSGEIRVKDAERFAARAEAL